MENLLSIPISSCQEAVEQFWLLTEQDCLLKHIHRIGKWFSPIDGRSPVPRDCYCNFYICPVVVYKERNFLGASLTPPKRVTCSHASKKALHP
ncbi:hypothetical protein TNCV_4550991 [Trichonephila clavipes]|uniref:Uncharacterized protein n=1 Tax=Trichonephila clavipes TaxID=2585209 RepID=A0A8X6S6H0_TRICX|nr:hypothetical protein TNCV_4550991 [Trichonephila clavipes]